MVSWNFAFKKGLVIFCWSILWGIIGGIVALIAISGLFSVALTDPATIASGIYATSLFLIVFITVLISSIGIYATIVKVTVETALAQVGERRAWSPVPPGPATPGPSMTTANIFQE